MTAAKASWLIVVILAATFSLQVIIIGRPNGNNNVNSHVKHVQMHSWLWLHDTRRDLIARLEKSLSEEGDWLDGNGSAMKPCNPTLVGPVDNESSLLNGTFSTTVGGEWRPDDCEPIVSVAIIVPFRNRHHHLSVFLPYMHSFLQKQQLHYRIFVVQQAGNKRFNRAKLLNIGYKHASKYYNFGCYIFHDVDLLPLDERNLYTCSKDGPLHLAVGIDKFDYQLPGENYFGGATGFTPDQFEQINGFSNRYFGWGTEDDDSEQRVEFTGQVIQRYPLPISRYRMIKHQRDKGNEENPDRLKLYNSTRKAWPRDGLNSLRYKLLSIEQNALFTKISVRI